MSCIIYDDISKQIVELYSPVRVLLFGSCAKGKDTDKSDIDLCVVVTTGNKRKLLADMYYSINSDKPVDIVLYTPAEWEQCVLDPQSFAYKINNEGVILYG